MTGVARTHTAARPSRGPPIRPDKDTIGMAGVRKSLSHPLSPERGRKCSCTHTLSHQSQNVFKYSHTPPHAGMIIHPWSHTIQWEIHMRDAFRALFYFFLSHPTAGSLRIRRANKMMSSHAFNNTCLPKTKWKTWHMVLIRRFTFPYDLNCKHSNSPYFKILKHQYPKRVLFCIYS